MRISFDVDATLVCGPETPCEAQRVPRLLRPWLRESLRAGASDLMRALAADGHEIWIYTTSLRSPGYMKAWLRWYGVRIHGVVNEAMHDQRVRARLGAGYPSKYPPEFGIDLHVDDSEGVLSEGQRHGFAVMVVAPSDVDWTAKVREAVGKMAARD